jgi:TRAP-type C4-dicarboxylate transport system permease small subunit
MTENLTMFIQTMNNCINSLLRYMLAIIMSVMIAAVVWQVFTRFVLQDPSDFTDELSRYLLIWIGILGGAYTFAIKRHLALELLHTRVGYRGQQIQTIVINIIIIIFSGFTLIYGGTELVTHTLRHGQISPSLVIFGHHLLIGYVYLVVPISGFIICYFGLIDLSCAFGKLCRKNPAEGANS